MITEMSPIKREILKQILKDQGKTQKQLFAELHLNESYCNRCLKEGWIATKNLLAISKSLDVSPEVLMGKEKYDLDIAGLKNSYGMFEASQMSWEDISRHIMYQCGYTVKDADKVLADPNTFLTYISLLQDVSKAYLNGVKNIRTMPGATYDYLAELLSSHILHLKELVSTLSTGGFNIIDKKVGGKKSKD